MSAAAKVYEALVAEFPSSMQTITQISRNTQGNRDFVKSSVLAFNFDEMPNLRVVAPGTERSPDALFLLGDVLYFVEFKEGRCERSNVRQKVHEGVLTLYQYVMARGIISRDDFFSIIIKFALVMRRRGGGGESFLATLEASEDYYSLKNMEGFVVCETAVRYVPGSIYKLLNKISSGVITTVDYVQQDQTIVVLP